MLLDVFDNPLRFCLAIIGRRIEAQYGRSVSGEFVDELEQRSPIEHLEMQCRAAVERQLPTYFHVDYGPSPGGGHFSRLVFPLWGEGRVSILLAAIAR